MLRFPVLSCCQAFRHRTIFVVRRRSLYNLNFLITINLIWYSSTRLEYHLDTTPPMKNLEMNMLWSLNDISSDCQVSGLDPAASSTR